MENTMCDIEQGFNDTVFNSATTNRHPKRNNSIGLNTSSKDGMFINDPDDKIYLFRNTSTMIHSMTHGILRPIRYNNLYSNRLVNGLANRQKGVFIIRYFNFYKNMDIKNIIRYYSTTETDIDTDTLNYLVNELTLFLTRTIHNELKFRIIKFIPEEDLQCHGLVYDSFTNGNIVIGDPTRLSTQDLEPVKSTLSIEIFDNKQDLYHFCLGKDIYPVFTNNNKNGEVEGHIKLVNHGTTRIDKKVSMEELKHYGVFYNRQEAVEFVNIDKQLEMAKLKHERMKIENELELTKLKRQIQLENFAADMYKRKLDIELSKIRFNSEKVKLYTSASSTYIKSGADIGVKLISMFIPLLKK